MKAIASLFCFLIASLMLPNATVCAQTAGQDEYPPEINQYMSEPAILVFSKTLGWRHDAGIAGADMFFALMARKYDYDLFTTENGATFNAADLSRFEIIIFNNVSGDALSPEQRQAFEDWMQAGGAWIGIHGTGADTMLDWDWFQDNLIGNRFIGHITEPRYQTADVINLDPAHPITRDLPVRFSHLDEWYSFDRIPDLETFTMLLGLDEASYAPSNTGVARAFSLYSGSYPQAVK